MICCMERVYSCGCHFIGQPLSASILRINPFIGSLELLTHLMCCIQQTSSVGGKDFSPQTLGLLQVLFLYRTNPEAYDLFAVSSLKDWMDRSYVEGLLVPFPCWIHQSECLQGSHSVPSHFLACLYRWVW